MLLPDSVIKNRDLLINTMKLHGFQVDPVEWWHFNFRDGKIYELLDIPPATVNTIYRAYKRK
jgi:zinc D-Ala-D-Ala dipeptidase